ncbi:hypothetical protein EOD39_19639 [Acipenser ruthenus]|uniref:Uncharacterized protein n=1 Tax=Acipenser ruthenus TaxID=7906 RepID=A0A444UXM9_ACIRT|nr:hypothetical protein EOD39_19639 [Acipenser ruthenus]
MHMLCDQLRREAFLAVRVSASRRMNEMQDKENPGPENRGLNHGDPDRHLPGHQLKDLVTSAGQLGDCQLLSWFIVALGLVIFEVVGGCGAVPSP